MGEKAEAKKRTIEDNKIQEKKENHKRRQVNQIKYKRSKAMRRREEKRSKANTLQEKRSKRREDKKSTEK